MFISIEGIECSGKSTLVEHLKEHSYTKRCFFTREPGGSRLSEDIRCLLLKDYKKRPVPESELLLFLAARLQNYHEEIEPQLIANTPVIVDRFHDSTIAYQGAGRELGVNRVIDCIDLFFKDKYPALTIVLDITIDTMFERLSKRNDSNYRDREHVAFYNRVRDGYHILSQRYPNRVHIIDGTLPIDEVCSACLTLIKGVF